MKEKKNKNKCGSAGFYVYNTDLLAIPVDLDPADEFKEWRVIYIWAVVVNPDDGNRFAINLNPSLST